MRQLPTLVSICVLLLAAGSLFRIRMDGALWTAGLYLACQALCTTVAWWGIQANKTSDANYLKIFAVVYGATLIFAVWYAFRMASIHPVYLGTWLIVSAMTWAASTGAIVYFEVLKIYGIRPVPAAIYIVLAQGFALTFVGCVSTVALATELKPALRLATIALSLFWSGIGALSYCFALGVLRRREVWLHLNNFIPAFMAIVIFGWLAFRLTGLQGELVHQPDHENEQLAIRTLWAHAEQFARSVVK